MFFWMCVNVCTSGYVTEKWVISHMNESCHICMSHGTYEWVVSHMNVTCHIWMSHVTYEWVVSRMNGSCHAYEWVMLHLDESCLTWMDRITREYVLSHMNVVPHMNEPFDTWMSHVTYEYIMLHLIESCGTSTSHVAPQRVISRRSEIHNDTCMNESHHTHLSDPYNLGLYIIGLSHIDTHCNTLQHIDAQIHRCINVSVCKYVYTYIKYMHMYMFKSPIVRSHDEHATSMHRYTL